jgi:hypothetical protein
MSIMLKLKRQLRRHKVAVTLFCSLVLVIIAIFAVNQILIAKDRARFTDAEKTKAIIANHLASYLGDNVLLRREQNECFHAEQGPYDNGKLWCQAATVLTLATSKDFNAMGNEVLSQASGSGLVTGSSSGKFPSYWFKTAKSISCQLEYTDIVGPRKGDARRIPFSNTERVAVSIACADRAKAAYYPLVD